MRNKVGEILSNSKRKAVVAAMCGVLALSLGTGAAFAANSAKEEPSKNPARVKSLVRNENGVVTYSTDDGRTWNQGPPEGFNQVINEDGSVTTTMGNPPKDGNGMLSMMMDNKDGKVRYSTDGGKTWSEDAPDGFTTTFNEDGSISVKNNGK